MPRSTSSTSRTSSAAPVSSGALHPAVSQVAPHLALAAEVDVFLRAFEGRPPDAPTPQAAGRHRLETLAGVFGLGEFERAVLALALAGELFPLRLRSLAAQALNVDEAHAALSPHLALQWLAGLGGASPAAFLPGAPLLRFGLTEVRPGLLGAQSLRELSVSAGVLAWLQGHDGLDPLLEGVATLARAGAALSGTQEALVTQLRSFLDGDPGGRAGVLYGADVSGRREVALRALGERGSLSVSVPALVQEVAQRPARLRALARMARLLSLDVLLDAAAPEAPETDTLNVLNELLGTLPGRAVMLCGEPLAGLHARAALPIEVPKPTPAEQRGLWAAALGLRGEAPELRRLTDQFQLDAERIGALAREVRADLPPGATQVARTTRAWQACRVAGRVRVGSLAQRIETGAGWDDLVLPAADLGVLRSLVAHVQHRAAVGDLLGAPSGGRGRAVAALFSGPSGTGKTLAAEVVAHALELDLYRIDLSGMVSKYIGETEKNLRAVFDAAEDGGAVLLFDEADALFGKRSEVKDAHDRYANIQVNYLLQRLESFGGVAVLTTNLESSMDVAFMRRLQFVLNFRAPQEAERGRLWRQVFPPTVPTADLDYAQLAALPLTGGSIRSVATGALFLSVARGGPVDMAAIHEALELEFRKMGRLHLGSGRPSGPWWDGPDSQTPGSPGSGTGNGTA